jgi:two-component system sensor histidine kinase YesM
MSVAVILALFLVMWILWDAFFQDLTLKHETDLIDKNVTMFAHNVDAYLESIRALSFDIIYSDEIQDALREQRTVAEGRSQLDLILNHMAYYVCLYTASGELVYEQGISHNESGFEQDAFISNESNLFESWAFARNTKSYPPYYQYQMLISYYRRVTELKSYAFKGRYRIDISELALRNLYASSSVHSFLMDVDGRIISSLASSQVAKNVSQLYPQSFDMQNSFIGSFMTGTPDEQYYVSYRKIPTSDWYFVSITQVSGLKTRNSAMRLYFITVLLVFFLIAVVVLFLCSKFINRPLKKLTKSMNEYRSLAVPGDMTSSWMQQPQDVAPAVATVQPKPSGDDITALSDSFSNMKLRIDSLIHSMYEMHRAELQMQSLFLQSQIDPHFLNNTLESIRFTARLNHDEQVSKQIKALSDILQQVRSQERFVTLAEEANLARQYILLRQQSLGDVVEFIMDIDAACEHISVPRLILQPLIENSIEHGMSEMDSGGIISVRAFAEQDDIVLEVSDNGVGMTAEQKAAVFDSNGSGKKIGISNIHKRLQLYFGEAYGVEISDAEGGGTIVRVKVPTPENPIYVNGLSAYDEFWRTK